MDASQSHNVSDNRIEDLVDAIVHGGSESEEASAALSHLGPRIVPFLARAFEKTRSWQGRTALMYHAIPFARVSEAAYELGVRGLSDRSYMVRYRACMVLAYSLRRDALPELRKHQEHGDRRTREDVARAIDAIVHGNHHYFVDTDHSGRTSWVVNETDRR